MSVYAMIKLLTDATELVFAINYSCLCYGPISDSNLWISSIIALQLSFIYFWTLSACCCMNILMACSCFWIYCTNTKWYKPIDRTLPWKPICKGRVGQGLIYTCLSLHLIHVGHFNRNIPPCSAANIHNNSLYRH